MRSLALATAAVAAGAAAVSIRPVKEMPTRLSIEPGSPYFDRDILRKVGVRLDGIERNKDVVEFDSEAGWIRVQILGPDGKPVRNDDGRLSTNKLTGFVEPYWKGLAPTVPVEVPELPATHFQNAAEAKRARKAAKLAAQAEKGAIGRIAVAPVEEPKKARKPRARKAAAA